MLVVIVIIGVMVTFATLSLGDGGRAERIETEARRLAALLQLAGDEAVLNARELGVRFDEAGYGFLALQPGSGWVVLSDDPLLRPRTLPDGIAVNLLLDGLPADLSETPEEPTPHLLLLSSGERTPCELEVGVPTPYGLDPAVVRYRLTVPLLGALKVTSMEPER